MNVSRIALATGVAASSVLLLSGTAFAHVSVQPQGEAAKGGYATVNFKVPNERDNASTVKLEVNLPIEHPLSSVMPQPVPGWKVEVTKSKLAKPLQVHGKQITEAVSKVTWTADGSKIAPGQFQQFPLSLGKLPEDADQLVFKALQTYDNKEVVRWIEETKEGAAEPESPAPVLKLSAATGDEHGGGAKDASAKDGKNAGHDEDAKSEEASDSSSDTTARILGIVGILVGVAGVAFGVLAGRRRTS
ncbi:MULTISPECIES: YcnI family protein [unclassified Streptomyces]|uniref:YcnI family copper-binding membrane protein n=1 Tax=unclassified Streptomyces TaxID=2593676 RepID=UPI002DD895F6|nr:YcnI family protein [Streptomyces sp. NBC_01750]WSB01802.1 YcnI family protein [Streptomyces sp. NBC_01794]WSD33951.1 YcnI family protein [Streptomyces sp. NBC_01750]